MSKCRNKKRKGFYFLGVLMLVLAFCIPVSAGIQEGEGEYEVYPTPHSVDYEETATTALTDQVDVTCDSSIDQYTKKRITDTLDVLGLKESTAQAASNTKLNVAVYRSGETYDAQIGASEFFEGTFEELESDKRFDKYILHISNGTITILGQDTDAAYRGVTTLKRMFEQLEGKTIRDLLVKDFAQVEYRGFIEGYYGNPWSYDDRKDLMEYGGEIKLNQYVFASKDDPFHRANWRALYPNEGDEGAGRDTIEKIAEMAKAGNESKCFYVYALHPFYTDKMSSENYDKDLGDLKAKFGQVIEAGVRQIAILEDDGRAPGATWSEQADLIIRLLNDVTDWLEEKKASDPKYADLKTDLLFCPGFMAYANDMTNSSNEDVRKIRKIHAGVGENVRIVMTGGKIWGDVTTAFADNFYNQVQQENQKGRYPYLWVNWPCSDNTHDSLIMGGHNSILRPNLDGSKYHGVILNPMQDSEPSKVGIFTAADFLWNVWDGETEVAKQKGDQAWEDSFKYIDHMTPLETDSSRALKGIAQHMITQSDGQANNTGSKFEESLNIKDDLQNFLTKLNADPDTITTQDTAAIREEFQQIKEDVEFYLQDGTNRRMASQLTPYASSLSDMAETGCYLMNALEAIINGNSSNVYGNFASAQEFYEKAQKHSFLELGNVLYAKGGRRYIIPFIQKVLNHVSKEADKFVNPENTASGAYRVTEVSYTPGKSEYQTYTKDKVIDGDDATHLWLQDHAAKDDYIQVDLGEEKPVGVVRIVVGNAARGNNKWTKYHLAYSSDGTNWEALDSYTGAATGADIYSVDLQGAAARYVRLINDTAVAEWISFSEFTVYPYADIIYTNMEDAGWQCESGVGRYELQPKQNVTLEPGKYVGLKLDRIHEVINAAATGSNMQGLTFELSVNAKEWTSEKKGNARYIRLMNQGNAADTFNLDSFVVTTKEVEPIAFEEASKEAEDYANQDARTMGTTLNWFDRNKSTKAKYCFAADTGDYVMYDLGQEVTIRSMKAWVGVNDKDYPRQAKIQGSLTPDAQDWKDIFEIQGTTEGSFETTAVNNGWTPGEGAVDVNYAYQGTAENFTPVKVRYLRIYFETRNAGRYVELSEIEINDNDFLSQINDPTFELGEDIAIQQGFEPQNLNDGDITSAFWPNGATKGSLIYHLSDDKKINRINILQNGSAISNAAVSVRTGADTWEHIGNLHEAYTAFYVGDLENVYAIKLEWENVVPTIYEIITLQASGEDLAEFMDKNIASVQTELTECNALVQEANDTLSDVQKKVQEALKKVNAAANDEDKLHAEIELQKLYAQQAAAESVLAEKTALKASVEAFIAKSEARKLKAQAEADPANRDQLLLQAQEKDRLAAEKQQEVKDQEKAAQDKKSDQASYEQAAVQKQKDLDNLLKNPPKQETITNFSDKTLKYKVIDASKQTVAVTGPVNKNKVSTVNIKPTVTYGNKTWKVTEISNKAFKGCKKLKKATIGGNVTKIGSQAFMQCKNLKTINLKKASKITSIGSKAFSGIHKKATIKVPAKNLKKYKSMLQKKGKAPKSVKIKK